jgi:outer membrane protein
LVTELPKHSPRPGRGCRVAGVLPQSHLLLLGLALFTMPALPARAADSGPDGAPVLLHARLSECVELALEQSPLIIQGGYSRESAAVALAAAKSAFLPSVSASYGVSRQLSGPRQGSYVDEATGLLVSTLGDSRTSGSQSVGTSISMSVYDRRNWANLAAGRHALAAAEMDIVATRQQVAFQTKQAYFILLQTLRLQQVQEEQILMLEEDLRRAQTMYELRSVPVSDVLTARASLESARAALIDRENQVANSRANLAFVVGLDPRAQVVPTDSTFAVEPLGITAAEAISRALGTHPELRSQRETILQSKEQLAGTRAGVRHPTVSMSSGYGWSLSDKEEFDGVEDLLLKNYGLSLRLSLSLPIFNRMSTEHAVQTQTLNYRRSLAVFQQAKRQVELDVRRTVLNINQYVRSVEANEAAVRASEESAKLAEERYSLGTGTFLERLQARSSLFSARSNLVQAIYNYHIQLAQLEQAMGSPLATESVTTEVQ